MKREIDIFNGRNHLHWRNKLNDDIKYKAILSHYSVTKLGTQEYKDKSCQDVPYENSIHFIYENQKK